MVKPVKKVSLGRGLSSLLGPDLVSNQGVNDSLQVVSTLSVEQLKPGKYQPRVHFEETELSELAQSIREVGVLQPILVRRLQENQYEIVAGERRWRAAQRAGLREIPTIIKDFNDEQASEVALIENIQRNDLSPLEEAQGYDVLIEKFSYTQAQLAERLGKSRSHIANTLRLLSLPDSIKTYIREGKLSAGHARALLNSDDAETLAREIIEKGLNVRETEKLRKKGTKTPRLSKNYQPQDEDIKHLEEHLSQILGMATQIQMVGEKGNLTVSFTNLQQLDALVEKLSHTR